MLKKMRWHFILAAMLAVFIMLVAVLAGINVWNYHTTAERADQRIQEIYGFESGKVPGMENSEENASQPVPRIFSIARMTTTRRLPIQLVFL